jgi:DNA-binding NarL/FixJ family response regulator
LKNNRSDSRELRKILVVDDNSELRKKIKEILVARLPLIQIIEAENAEVAAELLVTTIPDVMITDINLPGNGGLWLTEKAKLRHPKMPIIINSFSDNQEYRTAAFQLGANYFLSKQTNSMSAVVEVLRELPDTDF